MCHPSKVSNLWRGFVEGCQVRDEREGLGGDEDENEDVVWVPVAIESTNWHPKSTTNFLCPPQNIKHQSSIYNSIHYFRPWDKQAPERWPLKWGKYVMSGSGFLQY